MKPLLIHTLALALGLPFAQAQLNYTTGLDVWLDASDIEGENNSTLADGAEVSTWKNKGTTGVNDAIAILVGGGGGNNGVLVAGGGNGGQDAIRLSNTRYQFGEEWGDSANVTMYFVLYQDANPTAQGAILTDYGEVGAQLRNLRTGAGSEGAYLRDVSNVTNSVKLDPNPTLADQTWATIFYSFDATTKTATWGELGNTSSFANPAFDATTTFEGTHGGPVTLFSFHDGNNGFDFNGLVSEVLIYDHFLDAAARTQVENYLRSKADSSLAQVPAITDIVRNADGSVTLTWDSNSAAETEYSVFLSDDLALPLASWTDETDEVATGGNSTTYTIMADRLPADAARLFFRVAENE